MLKGNHYVIVTRLLGVSTTNCMVGILGSDSVSTFNNTSLASPPSLSANLWSTFSRRVMDKAGFSSRA